MKQSNINMDELSISSNTNQKVKQQQNLSREKTKQVDGNEHKPHFRIDWRQLSYYHKPSSFLSKTLWSSKKHYSETRTNETGRKRILNSLDGSFRSGELSAILGPSGAGKSTFLSTLFGSKQEGAYGQTKVTWFSDAEEQFTALPSQQRRSIRIANLPQNDHLLHHLTVYETLMFASKIKNAMRRPSLGKNFHRHNVKRVAKMLKLSECLDTRCGKLSGGQYKRVSIGQELLSEPDVIILDEPTSGLDAMTCLTTIQTLKSIVTKHPMSIILTIHQPDVDVFNLFDHIYVIAQGGLAIYEGPPENILSTLERVNLVAPYANYNPARLIVENAFLVETRSGEQGFGTKGSSEPHANGYSEGSQTTDEDDDDEDQLGREKQAQNYIKRSVLSLSEAISGKEMVSGVNKKDKRPLLNIAIQTLDGKLITSEQLAKKEGNCKNNDGLPLSRERWSLLKRLNQIQKARYQHERIGTMSPTTSDLQALSSRVCPITTNPGLSRHSLDGKSSAKSDYSSLGWSLAERKTNEAMNESNRCYEGAQSQGKISSSTSNNNQTYSTSLMQIPQPPNHKKLSSNRSLQALDRDDDETIEVTTAAASQQQSPLSDQESIESEEEEEEEISGTSSADNVSRAISGSSGRLKRQFDKRLSAKHNCSRQQDYPILYHAFLLTHRTWLSIVRDPIFFGIQACMHTTIPILLALIFGSGQEEGCPQIGSFDLVKFAYSDSENMIQGTVSSIRKSIGNIGIVFFEMFVLSFSINCITALVFPLDMYVLLKEYRNGWYSLRSYFFGRTLADLPVPIVLHSIAMAILYFLTGQPHSLWRFSAIVTLVIIASLVAQSVGLTIGALLMKSSQSAVLAAAGIVAPFFALSGFIVRIHTLPLIAQISAKLSYLYHLLNGFIILRYGFGRCQCKEEDFEHNAAHQIPNNLHTLASMWIGTYSDEFQNSTAMTLNKQLSNSSRSNVDPNIDVVDKMLNAFKMANSYGHQINDCNDVLPYAMLDFNLRDHDIYRCFFVLIIMLVVSRFITFSAIYYKVRSFA